MGTGLIICVSSLLHEACGRLLKKDMMILQQQVMIHPLQVEAQRPHLRFLLRTKKRSRTMPLP